jgi:hypothetical protein
MKEINRNPLVSIITINYNQIEVTMDLLQSLRKISYREIEIIVVDNASPSGNPDELKEAFPEIQLIKSKKNLGFAGGNNLGIRKAKGKYLFFINNDTVVPENIIEPLVDRMENNPKIGMVSPKIKFHWNPNLVQYAGFTKMNPYTIRNNSIGYHQPDGPEFDTAGETESIHGAAMMVSRMAIEKAGLMPEIYFLYYEEHDWGQMIKREGFKIYYEPKSYILHKESVSTGKNSPFKTYYITRNRMVFTRRNYSGLNLTVSILYQFSIAAPKNILVYLATFKFKHAKSYFRALGWNIVHFKSIHQNIKL